MAQMKEQIKTPEIIQVSNEEIANLKDAQFKTLVIRMITEMINIWLPLTCPLLDLACNPGMCSDRESNGRILDSQASTQSTEPH